MAIREEVAAFAVLGPLPSAEAATESDLDERVALLKRIPSPVSDEEASCLVQLFGPDECFGVAWTLLHLIETAPNRPTLPWSSIERSEWLRLVWRT